MLRQPNKTLSWADLAEAPVRQPRRQLLRFLRRHFSWSWRPVAVNGVLRRRWYIRRLKLWEYARGWALAPPVAGERLLDFGGGGTLPPFAAAAAGAEVHVLDIDPMLTGYGSQVARQRGWNLQGSSVDLAASDGVLPDGWGNYHAIQSFCVLEHIPYAGQRRCLRRLAQALRPGGRMVLTFEYGKDAPGEAPWHGMEELGAMRTLLQEEGLNLLGDGDFEDGGERFVLDHRHPRAHFTFGMLALERPR